jgi:tRNA pseudouridine38-40 synthase
MPPSNFQFLISNFQPQRYFLQLSYKGTNYSGWQVQKNAVGVQQVVNEKLSLQLGEEIYVVGCGRTDTGVHARKYFAHFDTAKALTKEHLLRLNIFLPPDITAQRLFSVPEDANARWSATRRTYTYIITKTKNPFLLEFAAHIHSHLDFEAMKQAAAMLLEYHDFEALSKINVQNKHHLCNIYEAAWKQSGDKLLFKITANRFLRGMVRIVVGTMLEVGKGKMTLDEMRALIEGKNRVKAGFAAPAQGLYLTDIVYPDGLLKEIL